MKAEADARPNERTNLLSALRRGREPMRQPRILWMGVLVWTAFVACALGWLLNGDGGLSVWVFQERDLNQPGFTDKVQAIFRGELGLQRTYPWILFGPFLVLMAWNFPLERERLRRNLPLNAAACLAFVWGCQAIYFRTTGSRANLVMVSSERAPGEPASPSAPNEFVSPRGLRTAGRLHESDGPIQFTPLPPSFSPPRSRKVSLRSMILDLLAYGAITGMVHSVNFYGRLRERERRALFLESNLANARLNTLKAQLQPHFLFNSLNAITTLLRRDPRLAETTLVSLSELLRLALSQSEKQELALREELEFVQRYLEIQQTRFGDKLRVEQEIDPQALDCLVPTLVLQPLVENAIRHGIEPSEKPGVVRITASRQNAKLVLTVEDDGVGLPSGTPDLRASTQTEPRPSGSAIPSTGIGLANLRERLLALYGAQQKLELTPRAEGGVIVRIELPCPPGDHPKPAPEF